MKITGSVEFRESRYRVSPFSKFEEMRDNKELSDVSIRIGNQSFDAHRVILAARIPHLPNILSREEKVIYLREIDPDVFETILNFAYDGRLKITAENVRSLILASGRLELHKVRIACWDFLEERLALNNVLEIRALAKSLHYSKLVEISNKYIQEHFEEFSETEDFLCLPYSCLKQFLHSDDLGVTSEENVYEAVMKWAKGSDGNRLRKLHYLLPKIRMGQLDGEYFSYRVASEEVFENSKIGQWVLEDAKIYHRAIPKGKRSHICSFNKNPRKYRKSQQSVSQENQQTHETLPQAGLCDGSAPGTSVPIITIEDNQTSPEVLHRHDVSDSICAFWCSDSKKITVNHYEQETKQWVTLSVTEGNQYFRGVAAVDDKIYVFFSTTIKIFHTATNEWSALDETHESVDGSGIVTHMGKIYFFCGEPHDVHNAVHCFDPYQNIWLAKETMMCQRPNLGVASTGKFIYLTGGFPTSPSSSPCSYVDRYDPVLKQWRKLSPMILRRAYHGCCSSDNKIYVCGGLTNKSLNSAEVYNCDMDHWFFISKMSISRHSLAVVMFRGRVFALGGLSEDRDYAHSVEIYDPWCRQWESGTSIPSKSKPAVMMTKAVVVCATSS